MGILQYWAVSFIDPMFWNRECVTFGTCLLEDVDWFSSGTLTNKFPRGARVFLTFPLLVYLILATSVYSNGDGETPLDRPPDRLFGIAPIRMNMDMYSSKTTGRW